MIYGSGKAPHPGFKGDFCVFDDARDFVAEVVGFVPDTYQLELVAYGDYSNAVRGRRRRAGALSGSPEVVVPRAGCVRLAWRELIERIYEVDPLVCRCGSTLRIVGVVTAPALIETILRHLRLWPPVPASWDQDEAYSQAPPSSEA